MLIKKDEQQVIKIGVLLPRSSQYPNAPKDFLNGIKLYFTLNENKFDRGRVELVVEDTGLGIESTSIEKAHKLIVQDQVILLTGLIEPLVGIEVGKMTEMAGLPTLFSGLGESALHPGGIPGNLYFNTLQFWQSYYLLGKYVRERLDEQPVIITSLYDCGYDPLKAFRLGLQPNGTNFQNEVVLHARSSEELQEEVGKAALNPSMAYALILHPKMLNNFINQYGNQMGKIVTTPFYTGSEPNIKYWAFPGWQNDSPSSLALKEGVKEFLECQVDMFHVLGFQQGQLIYDALSKLSSPTTDSETILETWRNYASEMPTGNARMDAEDHMLKGSIKIFSGVSTCDQFEVMGSFDLNAPNPTGLDELFTVRNSYTNPYLFF